MVKQALAIADAVLEQPRVINKPDEAKLPAELLGEAVHDGILVGRNICRRWLENPELADDIKQSRLASDTAAWICRLGVRVAQGEFQARKQGVLDELLEEIRVAKEKRGLV